MLYLDYAATTPPYEEVIDSIAEVMRRHWGNPSSIHRLGVQAERLMQRAKKGIAEILQVSSEKEIICTSGGTESNNLAIKGYAQLAQRRGRHLITSQIEHPSSAQAFAELESQGFKVTYLPVDETGLVLIDALKEAICEDTILVSLIHVNNEMGRVQPIAEIGKLLAAYPQIKFHVDAIQSITKLPLLPREAGIDLLSASAHKFGGPKGIGFLYCREGIQLQPQLVGGGQQHGMRSGTENVPLIVGMAKALRMSMERRDTDLERMYRIRQLLVDGIAAIPGLTVSGSAIVGDMAPHIVHFMYPGTKAEVIVHALEQSEIYISTKSACAAGNKEPSKVLLAMGYEPSQASSGLRVSFSGNETERDAQTFIDALQRVVKMLAPAQHKYEVGRGRRR
ncbi:cysteine desulfurase family protein [Paenibacillus eucommiae]|uniref:Cysteine desulfurase n=1 Tax=Paenibacillus eucommiae TaxID=1355755 RepID=A0ABS4IZ02_9BACL|nr:cysteine desulfurase family protein [Paenibacillus eucommiae]MBP1992827.1 cysteine desulfurase [Paenibacillus eucommiae]